MGWVSERASVKRAPCEFPSSAARANCWRAKRPSPRCARCSPRNKKPRGSPGASS